ncbi:MAG: nitrile hydratase accessory protein [Burkholderiales bacterium]|nr:MAG: nitrile hydratase accessory protein [Burkholderiales bacterium]
MRAALPSLPCDDGGPVFRAPWEAQAFAMVVALHARGLFTWAQWAQALSEAIAEAQSEGDPDTGENYYRHWMRALERMAIARGLVDPGTLAERKAQWDRAARATPHGKPIELR